MEELPARKEEVEHAGHEGVQFKKLISLLAQTTPDMQFTKRGCIAVESEATGRTTKKGVFAGRAAGMAIDKFLKDDEWWDPNAPKRAEAAPATK